MALLDSAVAIRCKPPMRVSKGDGLVEGAGRAVVLILTFCAGLTSLYSDFVAGRWGWFWADLLLPPVSVVRGVMMWFGWA